MPPESTSQMADLRPFLLEHPAEALAAGGFLIGLVFGLIAETTGFCAMGAVSDAVTFHDQRRLRSWMLAVAVAILGVAWLRHAGGLALASSMYLAPRLNWAGNVLGGLMFGAGMALAGGCASRNLVRAGTGDLRSLLSLLVLGISAYAALGGILGPARAALETATAVPLATPTQSLADLVGGTAGLDTESSHLLLPALAAVLLLLYCLSDRSFLASPRHLLSGLGVGAAVIAGWALTGLLYDEMAARPLAPLSLSFVRPTGDTLEWLQRQTALGLPGFGVATVLGTLAGAGLAALLKGRFALKTFRDVPDTARHLGGAVLMGTGGVMAMGCSVGQGITGLSTLAVGSVLAFASILAGTVLGLKALERWAA